MEHLGTLGTGSDYLKHEKQVKIEMKINAVHHICSMCGSDLVKYIYIPNTDIIQARCAGCNNFIRNCKGRKALGD